jgi:hypothetical protein
LEGLGVDGIMILKRALKKEFAGDMGWILARNCKTSS